MPGPLTDADIAQFRQLAQDLAMPDTCSVIRLTRTPDGMGGHTLQESVIATGVPCRYRLASGQEYEHAQRRGLKQPYTVIVPPSLNLEIDDQLVINTLGLQVKDPGGPSTYEIRRTVMCEYLSSVATIPATGAPRLVFAEPGNSQYLIWLAAGV